MREADSPQNWKTWKAIYPPTSQNYSQKVIQATLEVAKKILLFPEYAIRDVINEAQMNLSPKVSSARTCTFTCTRAHLHTHAHAHTLCTHLLPLTLFPHPQMIAVDWTLYLYLLEHDRGVLTRNLFSTDTEYEQWKKIELSIVKGLLNGGNIDQPRELEGSYDDISSESRITEGYSIAQLSLTRTKGLHKKVLMSDVYSVIHFQDLYTVSPITNSIDQCPVLNHKLSL